MQLCRSAVLCLGCLLLASGAFAQSGARADTAKTPVALGVGTDAHTVATKQAEGAASIARSVASKSAAGEGSKARRDPKGKKGISPFWEALRHGDEAAHVHDLTGAETAYEAALSIDPKNAVAHLRRGQVLVGMGKLAAAEVAYRAALQLTDKDATLHAAALFVLADLKERQGKSEEAGTAWSAYADYLRHEATAKGYPETASERDKRLKTYAALVLDSKVVRERIELRLREVDEAKKRRAAKYPNEGR
ncbi:MAG TPA: tetratricopeptide repeat protein [Polyangiaceae bacterium]